MAAGFSVNTRSTPPDEQTAPFPTVAVIIVNYRKGKRLLEGLESIRKQSVASSLSTVIVDNSVCDSEASLLLAEIRPRERLVINTTNNGYSKACNAAVRAAGASDYVFLLNPDIILDNRRTIELLVRAMEADSSIGVLGCLQRNDDGSYVESARFYPYLWKQVIRRLISGSYTDEQLLEPLLRTPPADYVDVDWLQSSVMFVRGPIWNAIGGLDETYYVFMADVDFCRQAHALGSRVVITSRATVRADGLRASAGGLFEVFRSRALRIHIYDLIKYYVKVALVGIQGVDQQKRWRSGRNARVIRAGH